MQKSLGTILNRKDSQSYTESEFENKKIQPLDIGPLRFGVSSLLL